MATLTVVKCAECPFSDVDIGPPRKPYCDFEFATKGPDAFNENWGRREFGIRNDRGRLLFPGSPPSWCPLRKERVTVEIRDE